jgi:arginyl-tRNA synthetase
VFQVARRCGLYDPTKTSLEHVKFGVVLGEDGKKLKTRSGETVKLIDLLEESVIRAKEGLVGRNSGDGGSGGDDGELLSVEEVAKIVGIGAVK